MDITVKGKSHTWEKEIGIQAGETLKTCKRNSSGRNALEGEIPF